MFKYISVFLVVVGLQEARVDGSAGLRFSGKPPLNANASSYAEYEPWNWLPNATLQFFFQTSARKKALLFYQDDGGNNYFMTLFLTSSGYAEFRARLGQEWEEVREIKRDFADSQWHKVRIKIDGTNVHFSIGDENDVVHTPTETPIQIDSSAQSRTSSVLFVAGIPLSSSPDDFSYTKLFTDVFTTGTLSLALFEGCIGDIRVHRPSSGQLDKAKLRKSANAEDTCFGACHKSGCYNGGRCIDKIWHSECDCSATGFKGERCKTRSLTLRMNIPPEETGGYIYQTLSDDSPFMDTERNTINFMFLTEKENGVILYMGRDKDHLVVELVNRSLRVEANVGGGKIKANAIRDLKIHHFRCMDAGPIVVFGEEHDLSDSCWHHVEVRRRKARLTVIIDKEKSGKISQESSPSHYKLNLDNKTSNVIYYGGGPSEVLRFAQAKPLFFRGFLKQFHFEHINVIENAIRKSSGFSIEDPHSRVGLVEKYNFLLQSAEERCRPEPPASGCSPDDDGSDPTCNPSTTPTKGITKGTVVFSTTRKLSKNPNTPKPLTKIQVGAEKQQNPTPRPKGVSAWVIIVIVVAAMAVVLIAVFFLYRWNHRYTGSFKPSKSEEAQSQESGADAEQQQGSRMYNQPAFFVYKPPKKTTTAQSPPVSI